MFQMNSKKNLTYLCLFIFICLACIIAYNIYNKMNNIDDNENVIETFESKLQKLKNNKNHEKFGDIAEKIKAKEQKVKHIKNKIQKAKEDKKKRKEKFLDSDDDTDKNSLTRRVFNNVSSYKSDNKYTIDDVITRSERLKTDKMSMDYIKKEIVDYYNSFKKEKFANTSSDTREALNKFPLYKEKFFEIFKK
jgi:hypothetical protein